MRDDQITCAGRGNVTKSTWMWPRNKQIMCVSAEARGSTSRAEWTCSLWTSSQSCRFQCCQLGPKGEVWFNSGLKTCCRIYLKQWRPQSQGFRCVSDDWMTGVKQRRRRVIPLVCRSWKNIELCRYEIPPQSFACKWNIYFYTHMWFVAISIHQRRLIPGLFVHRSGRINVVVFLLMVFLSVGFHTLVWTLVFPGSPVCAH